MRTSAYPAIAGAPRRLTYRGNTPFRLLLAGVSGAALAAAPLYAASAEEPSTATPIKHVIIVIGENHTFDNVFATYRPKDDETVLNLLSKGIVNADGTPGKNFAEAAQQQAWVRNTFSMAPTEKTPYHYLPPAMTDGAPTATSATSPPFTTEAIAAAAEPYLPPAGLKLLTTGATGLPGKSVDTRVPDATTLPNGPYPWSNDTTYPYDSYRPSPVHRFFQMWQQTDCAISHATAANPSGCLNDLFPWVETTIGAGSNGKPQPSGFTDETTGEGSTSMAFYNMARGDAPYLKKLAEEYTISDNYHQAIEGGTGANHIALGTGLAIYYSDSSGNPVAPPSNQIENPNPAPGTNNWYTQDGYSGGSYVNCSDPRQPGVKQVLSYLAALPYKPSPKCAANAYYLVNNYNPGYNGDGTVNTAPFTIPPSAVPTIGDTLNDAGIPWRYYGGHWNEFVQDPSSPLGFSYCNICNPFLYETAIMADPAQRTEHLKDISDFDADVAEGRLPAVSFIKPDGLTDGHPASSKLDIFESFTKRIVHEIKAHPRLWATTAILITVDEGGGSWDSGYIQPLDFFGDGTRIPAIMVSPYSRGGHVSHVYSDHVSYLKFIEYNWRLDPVSRTGRDNLPNPKASDSNPYVPTNSPAIGDLTDMFHFDPDHDHDSDR